jgi:hypothetical protein
MSISLTPSTRSHVNVRRRTTDFIHHEAILQTFLLKNATNNRGKNAHRLKPTFNMNHHDFHVQHLALRQCTFEFMPKITVSHIHDKTFVISAHDVANLTYI